MKDVKQWLMLTKMGDDKKETKTATQIEEFFSYLRFLTE